MNTKSKYFRWFVRLEIALAVFMAFLALVWLFDNVVMNMKIEGPAGWNWAGFDDTGSTKLWKTLLNTGGQG